MLLLAVVSLLAAPARLAPAGGGDSLRAAFLRPPASAKPQTWWHWMNGNVSATGITKDLEAMKAVGLGGAQIFNIDVGFPDGPAPFAGPKWMALVVHAAREAHRLGLELTIHNGAGWSSTGGPWIPPALGMQVLAWSAVRVHGPARFDEVLPKAQAPEVDRHVDYYRDIMTYAFPTPAGETEQGLADRFKSEHWLGRSGVEREDDIPPLGDPVGAASIAGDSIRQLGKPDADGKIAWDVPAGDWTILRLGYTPTGVENHPAPASGRGLEVDKLNRAALDAHWAAHLDKIFADVGASAGHNFDQVLTDSYEVGTQNWTPAFRQDFERLRGYDPLPYLPAVTGRFVESPAVTERFLWDLRHTIADLYDENYYGYFRQSAHKRGLKFATEPYGNGGFDTLRSGGEADMPMGEFWPPNGMAIETVKLAAAAGHTYGRQVIGAESFTSDQSAASYREDPFSIKALGDRAYCLGVNRYIFHRYAMQPWEGVKPGMTMGPWGLNFERTITWWKQAPAWISYISRCQAVLQRGKFVADALYYVGEDEPQDLPFGDALRPTLPPGYDYDGCDAHILETAATVKGGRIALADGMRYRVLILPRTTLMTPAVIHKVRLLVERGAIVVGPKPVASPSLVDYPNCDAQIRHIADAVWGDVDGVHVHEHAYGKGRVFDGLPLNVVFRALGLAPDFSSDQPNGAVDYIHRSVGKDEAYFVSNQSYAPKHVLASFRNANADPELWHPASGLVESAPVWFRRGARTFVQLDLDPAGSVFVVFRPGRAPAHFSSLAKVGKAPGEPKLAIDGAWYAAADGTRLGSDVTKTVRAYVAAGHTSVPANNSLFGDPAYNHVKRLIVRYRVDGKAKTREAPENGSVDLVGVGDMFRAPDYAALPGRKLLAWTGGSYSIDGRTRSLPAAKTLGIAGPWSLAFPPHWGAPARASLPRLISWSDSPVSGIKYFSGTATYTKRFSLPAGMVGRGRSVQLSLGEVKNFARVWVNGHDLGVLWKAPFVIDVSKWARRGPNAVRIDVTNLWPNRLIGDEQQPPEATYRPGGEIAAFPTWLLEGKPKPKTGRYTFVTWKFYDKNSPLLKSGLIGPVTIRSATPARL